MPVPDTVRQAEGAFLIYLHGESPDTLAEGETGQVVGPVIGLYLHLGEKVEIESAREHFQVEPADALAEPLRWSDHLRRLYFQLQGVEPGRQVTITVRDGLEREGLEPLPRDYVCGCGGSSPRGSSCRSKRPVCCAIPIPCTGRSAELCPRRTPCSWSAETV